MHSFMAVAVVARLILLTVHSRGAITATAPEAQTNNLRHADATSLHTDEDELMAAIVSARISEPDRVTGVLNELRVESTGHLRRLDLEEWSEMMAEMRSGGVALGTRNKLRLLVAVASSRSHTESATLFSGGQRRVQTGSGDTESTAKRASEQEPNNKPTSTVFGVSGDSAPHVPVPSVDCASVSWGGPRCCR
jgi:hypothetical protein